LLQAPPRQLRRVGAERYKLRTSFAEERQVPVDVEELADAMIAMEAIVEDHDQRTVRKQSSEAPDLAVRIGQLEVGCPLAEKWVIMRGDDVGMTQDLLE